jgi:hypothetical protein
MRILEVNRPVLPTTITIAHPSHAWRNIRSASSPFADSKRDPISIVITHKPPPSPSQSSTSASAEFGLFAAIRSGSSSALKGSGVSTALRCGTTPSHPMNKWQGGRDKGWVGDAPAGIHPCHNSQERRTAPAPTTPHASAQHTRACACDCSGVECGLRPTSALRCRAPHPGPSTRSS